MTPGTRERLRGLVERLVSADEVRDVLERPIDGTEREDILALARWFRRRYPTGAERLAYVRQAHARWKRMRVREADRMP